MSYQKEPWMIDYATLVVKYPDYAFSKLSFDATDYPILAKRWEKISRRFFNKYCNRMIGLETLDLWWVKLQDRFDSISDEFERAYELYAENGEAITEDVLEGYKDIYSTHTGNSGADKRTLKSKTKSIDTPDSRINDNDEYADTLNKSEGEDTTSYGKQSDTTMNNQRIITGSKLLENVNKNIYSWKDWDTEFVNQFENLFLGILWS